jgi:ABC-type uncharacterized transport system fused permease/ATPase subunit
VDWLFLDEATSVVDEATKRRLYRLLVRKLSRTAVLSVGNRKTLRRFHRRHLVVQRSGN